MGINKDKDHVNKGLGSVDEEMQRKLSAAGDDTDLTRDEENEGEELKNSGAGSRSAGTGTGNSAGSTDEDA